MVDREAAAEVAVEVVAVATTNAAVMQIAALNLQSPRSSLVPLGQALTHPNSAPIIPQRSQRRRPCGHSTVTGKL